MIGSDGAPIDLDCGIGYGRIAAWLDDELELPRHEGGWIFDSGSDTCRIVIESLEARSFKQVSLERTHLVATGDATALAAFGKLFTLRFISAGG